MLRKMVFTLATLTFITGCGPDICHLPKTVPANGVVTLDGNPVDATNVVFISSSTNYHASAITDAQGRFELNAFKEKKGAVPGTYSVEVNKTVVTGNTAEGSEGGDGATLKVSFGLPQKYASIGTSGLSYTIPDAGDTEIKLELKSK